MLHGIDRSLTVLALSLTTPGRPKLGAALVLLFLFCCQRQSCNHMMTVPWPLQLCIVARLDLPGHPDAGRVSPKSPRSLVHCSYMRMAGAGCPYSGKMAKHGWQLRQSCT